LTEQKANMLKELVVLSLFVFLLSTVESNKKINKILSIVKNIQNGMVTVNEKVDALTPVIEGSCSCCNDKPQLQAIIVTGQGENELLYSNGTKFCKLPDFPENRAGHSQHGLTTCAGSNGYNDAHTSCITLTDGGWTDNEVSLLDKRKYHVSFVRPDGKIQLMSGQSPTIQNAKSTEIVDLKAKTSVPGYDLINNFYGSRCGIQPGDFVVATGYENEVYDINGFVKSLPSLNTPRDSHGCGHYINNENQVVYLVTGGWIGEYLDSTELLIEGAASWIISDKKLPTGRLDMVGISINNKIFMTGGIDDYTSGFLDEVIEFNTDTEEWSLVENMRDGKRLHATSVVDINIAKQFCLD